MPKTLTDVGRWKTRETHVPRISISNADGVSDNLIDGSSDKLVAPSPSFGTTSAHTDQSHDLQTRLHFARVSVGEKPGFIPNGKLNELVTEDVVTEILNRDPPGQTTDASTRHWRSYARKICSTTGDDRCTFRKIFATLVLIDKTADIVSFIDNDPPVDDSFLPLVGIPMPGTTQTGFLGLRNTPATPVPFLKSWPPVKCANFEQEQWAMVAPCFEKPRDRKVKFYDLHDKTILPWIWEDDVERRGGFSTVKHVKIDEQHHEFGDYPLGDGTFAVKCLDETASESVFRAEVATLERFTSEGRADREHTREHLVSLLVTFRQAGRYSLLFHWAPLDLIRLWNSPKSPNDANLTWFLGQCCGIARGVHQIHEYQSSSESEGTTTLRVNDRRYGRHTDIKPQNLLVFQKRDGSNDYGTIQLTDFGLCEFRGVNSRSNIPQAALLGGTPTYSPPEAYMPGAKISRSYDIWSLGCVFLEFISWYLGGQPDVDAFIQARLTAPDPDAFIHARLIPPVDGRVELDNFWEPHQPDIPGGIHNARVKKQVLDWIDQRLQHPRCTEPLQRFLRFIRDHMLVIETVTQGTDHPATRRAPSSYVHAELKSIYDSVTRTIPEHPRTTSWQPTLARISAESQGSNPQPWPGRGRKRELGSPDEG